MLNSELGRRLVAMAAVGLAVALQWTATTQGETPERSSTDMRAALPVSLSPFIPAQPNSSYGLQLLDDELVLTGTSNRLEASQLHPQVAGLPGPAAASPMGGSYSTANTGLSSSDTGETDWFDDSVPVDLWPENRDSAGAPIVLNEYHTATLGMLRF